VVPRPFVCREAFSQTVAPDGRSVTLWADPDRLEGLELTSGHVVDADAVISAADLRFTLDQLLGGTWPSPRHEALFAGPMVPSVCVLSYGLRGPLPQGADVILHRQLFDPPQAVAGHTISALGWKTFEHDPTLALAPKTVVSVNLDSPYGFWKPLAGNRARYDEARDALGAGVRTLLGRAVPGFSALVETVDVATPLTVERFTSNHGGQFMTFVPPLGRPPRHAPRQVPGLRDFWLAGMWVAPPGGLPNALKSGRDVVQVMCKADGQPFHAG
jgi:phytoene dehydrogenase-like protein